MTIYKPAPTYASPNSYSAYSWEQAVAEYLQHVEAALAPNTHAFYAAQLGALREWAEGQGVEFGLFRKRDLDRYILFRAGQGLKPTTVAHGAKCAKSLCRWCSRNEIMTRDPLADYRVRNAPAPARPMPTDEEVLALLGALESYWDVRKRPEAKLMVPERRAFHRERNTAIYLGLLDTACRIGEMLELRLEDYKEGERRILVRQSKGREPRALPVSAQWAEALASWLRLRRRVMAGREDCGLLFVSETGEAVPAGRFNRGFHRLTAFAGLPAEINLHSLRRYSINRHAKVNLLAAQQLAGHKKPQTTLLYTKLDPDFLRDVHEETGVLRKLVESKKKPRKLV